MTEHLSFRARPGTWARLKAEADRRGTRPCTLLAELVELALAILEQRRPAPPREEQPV